MIKIFMVFSFILAIYISCPSWADTEVWLAPLSNIVPDTQSGEKDFGSLATNPQSWKFVSKHIHVFKIYGYYTANSSDSELLAILSVLATHQISLALEARVLTSAPGCGMQHGDGGEYTIHLLERIKRLGGVVQYLAMDEPLKHLSDGPDKCRGNLREGVRDIAAQITKYRVIFPNLAVGDIEPVGLWSTAPNLLADSLRWVEIYEAEMGEKLAFFHADVGWATNWIEICTHLQAELTKRGVPFGMIYNGTDLAPSIASWSAEAREHFIRYEDGKRPRPPMAIIQSWVRFPENVLPETDLQSLTGIASSYLNFNGLYR